MNWQPIETAPKEVAVLVTATKHMQMCVAMLDVDTGEWETETPNEWVRICRPTHWMTLPEPPSE